MNCNEVCVAYKAVFEGCNYKSSRGRGGVSRLTQTFNSRTDILKMMIISHLIFKKMDTFKKNEVKKLKKVL